MKQLKYLTVSNNDDGLEQTNELLDKLSNGWCIISSAGNSYSVHYIIEKGEDGKDKKGI